MKSKRIEKRDFNKTSKGGDTNVSDSKEPVQAKYLEVKVYDNFDRALRAFRALVQKERVLSIYKEKQSYEKPSDKRRRKRNEMKRKRFELENKSFSNLDDSFEKKRKKGSKVFEEVPETT